MARGESLVVHDWLMDEERHWGSLNQGSDIKMETHSELQRKIKALEKLLQEETFARSAFEHELYEIKDSLAWRVVTRCRHFRNRLLGEDTRRRKSYDLMRDILKGAILL